MRHALRLIVCIAAPQAVGGLAAVVTVSAVRVWYPKLVQPGFAPPSWVFAPAWTLLYLLMGTASFVVWQQGLGTPGVRRALGLYAAQLVLNGLWSFVFFGLGAPGFAFAEILVLLAAIVWTTAAFFRLSRLAGWLMVPYVAWVTFASALNFAYWRLNPDI